MQKDEIEKKKNLIKKLRKKIRLQKETLSQKKT
jgi:hypothetical protein